LEGSEKLDEEGLDEVGTAEEDDMTAVGEDVLGLLFSEGENGIPRAMDAGEIGVTG
jgi:hypothetical protein